VSDEAQATSPFATAPLGGRREVTFQRFEIAAEDGPDRGHSAASTGDELSIGTADGNDLQLTEDTVSRHHCSITVQRGRFLLRDLGSMNGTRLGGFRIESAYLKDGASFRLGRAKLRFRCVDGQNHEPLGDAFGQVVGRSEALRRIFAVLERVAPSDSTVLLEGETGTGKGLLTQAIHDASPRKTGPLVVVDCASIPAPLVESELFGHVRGAFTGAEAQRTGAFESARGGTIFLDEVGELPLELQPKLLRALEERTIKRVGSDDRVDLDVRVVAATNRDLRAEVNRGVFRADLFYRLNIVRLRVPALRERSEDIGALVAHFYAQFRPEAPEPPAELVEQLERQAWPGNVRELRAAVERAVLLGDLAPELAPPTSTVHLDGRFDPEVRFRVAKEQAIARWERAYLRDLLREAEGNVSRAARLARMDRNHLRELLRRHGLDKGSSP